MTRRHSHAHYGQKIKVKRVIPHPQYSQYVAHDNDIALFQVKKIDLNFNGFNNYSSCFILVNNIYLFMFFFLFFSEQLATRVAFHDHLLPVCLPPQGMKELEENTKCIVIGWGKKQSGEYRKRKVIEFISTRKIFSFCRSLNIFHPPLNDFYHYYRQHHEALN